jgi:MYXO-CTERM domain-containing protein
VPEIAGVQTSTPHFCGQSEFGCCESHIVLDATVTLAPTSEPVLYDVLDGTTRIAIDRPGPLDGMLFCDAGYASFHDTPFAGHPATWLAPGPSRQLSIVARDVAGHASAPISVTIAGDCGLVGVGVDAGPGGDGAGTAADAAVGAGGCQVAGAPGGRGATGLLWAPLAFMLALSLRRRRRLAALALVVLGACDSATPVTTIPLPTGPVCDVPLVPRTLADGLACSGIVFVDDAQVYWSSEAGISGTNKCGGAPEVAIADSPHTLVSILDGGDSWYTLSFGGEARRTSKTDPGQSELLGDGFRSAYHMEMDGDDLLLSAEGRCLAPSMPDCGFQRSMLWRVHGDGSPPVAVIVQGDGQIFDFALVGGWIYVTGYLNDGMPGLRRLRPDGSELEFVTHDGETVQAEDLVADPSNGELFMHSFEGLRALQGDDLRLVSTEVNTDRGLVLDSHFVYALGSDGRLVRVPRAGGPAVTLLEGSNVWSFAIDAGAIYAYDCGDPAGRVVTFRR